MDKFFVWFVLLVCIPTVLLHGQVSKGILLAHFNQNFGFKELNVDYSHKVVSLQYVLNSRIIGSSSLSFDCELLPQIAITFVKDSKGSIFSRKGVEIGVVPGVSIRKSFFSNTWELYIGSGIGPQYTSTTPDRQKSGFLFSNTVFGGSRIKLSNTKSLDLRMGFRHQSNASLAQPNGGINALFLSVGIMMI